MIAFQGLSQKFGKSLSVLWNHIDSTIDRTLLMAAWTLFPFEDFNQLSEH
jgi:hypothetical protein